MGFKKKAMASANAALADLDTKAKAGAAERAKAADESAASALSEMRSKPAAKPATSSGSFGSAFASARKAGDKTFTWKGKSYTTDVAGDKKPARASTPTASSTPKPRGDAMAAARSRGISDFAPKKSDRWSGAKPGNLPKPEGKKPFDAEAAKAVFRNSPTKPAAPAAKPKTREEERADKLKRLRTAADAPGASRYAKDRYKFASQTNMYAKGGSIDGAAVRGKTKAKRK